MSRPFVEVVPATSRPVSQPQALAVVQEIGHHDVIVFEHREKRVSSPRWRTGSPIQIRFGWLPSRMADSPAYVFDPRPTAGPREPGARNEVTCLGITYPLKAKGIASWTDTTTWKLVEEFAQRHRLRHDVDRVGRLRSSVMQRGRSQWEMLKELAEEDGLLLFVRDNTLHLRDPQRLEDEQRGAALRFVLMEEGNRRVRKIRTELGELSVDGPSSAEFITTGESPDGESITVSSWNSQYLHRGQRRGFSMEFIDAPIRSVSDGREEIAAAERRSYFTYTAEAELDGDPNVQPGTGVILEGVGVRASGYWTVLKAEHRLTPTDYRVIVELGRAQPGRMGNEPDLRENRRVMVTASADLRSYRRGGKARRIGRRWVT